MPSTLWSAPPQGGNNAPLVNGTLSVTKLDLTPGAYIIPAGMLNLGTRVRLVAWGSYSSASSTTTTLAFGFYMTNPGTVIGSALALAVGPAIPVFAVAGMPWMIEYFGIIASVTTIVAGTSGSASIVGQGRCTYNSATGWTGARAQGIMPQTLAAETVTQTANGLNTTIAQELNVGCDLGVTATGMTSITCNELTCELIG
jgi:hypothetical protein